VSTPRYSYLPWLRHGLAAGITTPDDPGAPHAARVQLDVTVTVNASTDVPAQVRMLGPGDVLGLDPRAIVRTDPPAGATDFEPNFMPLVELYEEDLPWRYTPAAAGADARLSPWIALVVLTPDEFERDTTPGLPAPAIRVLAPAATLPPPDQGWAWAHVQINADLAGADIARVRQQLESDPDSGVARLLCPRRLLPDTPYHAFLVPMFETGRLAGLGEDVPATVDGLAPSWGAGQDRLPVYHEWTFRTGQRGDFEYLVRLLQPRTLDSRIGTRDMDVTEPGAQLPPIVAPPELGLEGALRAIDSRSTEWPDPAEFQEALRRLLDLPDELLRSGPGGGDPLVAPPIYGCWPAGVQRLGGGSAPRWLEQLNLDPRTRATAGLGARSVRERQEALMDEAWEQVGAVAEANRLLRRATLAREVGVAMFEKHLTRLEPARALALTQPVHGRVLVQGSTVESVARSALAGALLDASFRRVARPRGPIARRAAAGGPVVTGDLVERVNSGELVLAPEPELATGAITLEALANSVQRDSPAGRILDRMTRIAPEVREPRGFGAAKRLPGDRPRLPGDRPRLPDHRPPLPPDKPRRPGDVFHPPVEFEVEPTGHEPPPLGKRVEARDAALRFADAASSIEDVLGSIPPIVQPPPVDLAGAAGAVIAALDPRVSIARRTAEAIRVIPSPRVTQEEPLRPIAAAPLFPEPQYRALAAISPELMIPNLNLIPENTIGLLRSNRPFIESFMAGANHEMAREFLWRDYVADQRATFFLQFWDFADAAGGDAAFGTPERAAHHDMTPMATWSPVGELGTHAPPGRDAPGDDLVLAVRGQLLKRYPTAVIYAAEAAWAPDRSHRVLATRVQPPIFHAEVEPDLRLLGFPLSVDAVRGDPDPAAARPGWFFVLKERPGDARFGLDVADTPASVTATSWRDLSWGHLGATQAELDALTFVDVARPPHHVAVASGPRWGGGAAEQAAIHCQDPVLVGVHASEMLR
jgi:hypothetical protein